MFSPTAETHALQEERIPNKTARPEGTDRLVKRRQRGATTEESLARRDRFLLARLADSKGRRDAKRNNGARPRASRGRIFVPHLPSPRLADRLDEEKKTY